MPEILTRIAQPNWRQFSRHVQTMWAGMTPPKNIPQMIWLWMAFAVSILSFLVLQFTDGNVGTVTPIFDLLASATCGWSWLVARTLFRPREKFGAWPYGIVGMIILSGFALSLMSWTHLEPVGLAYELSRVMSNINGLASSFALVMLVVEALHHEGSSQSKSEKMFRRTFAFGFGSLVFISAIWLSQAAAHSFAASWSETIKTVCATIALAGSFFAVQFRLKHPLAAKGQQDKRALPTNISAEDAERISHRIAHLMESQTVFTTQNLKVSDVAKAIGEPEYKISKCITSEMGFRNFSHLINTHRIDLARQMLSDPQLSEKSILSVGLDCGFSSIGPFNRAFKDLVGLTPSEFKKSANIPLKANTS